MDFEKDIFISYAHLDNEPIPPDQIGWITRFHESLEAFVNTRMGEKVRIWRDSKLQGNDIFSDEIVKQFSKTAILVSILTPRYVRSEWCSKEMREFCEAAEKTGGVVVDHKSRVIKVIKTPVDSEEALPDVAKQELGYKFYETGENETPLELDPAFGTEFAQAYNQKVAKLAWEIKQLLQKLRETDTSGLEAEEAARRERPTIFLAECSFDQEDAHEKIEMDLKASGYEVLPDRVLPKSEAKQVAEVVQLLGRCQLSIHLIGRSYGSVPDGPSRKSNVVLQNELAAACSRETGLNRIIWLPEGTMSDFPLQKEFIDALHRDAELQFGADLITADLEHLKGEIHSKLKQIERRREPQIEVADTGPAASQFIYLICTNEDRKETVPLRKALIEKGLSVDIPAFEGDAAELRKVNEGLLSLCDAIIVFYGAGDEAWKRSIDNDLKKLPSYRQGKPLKVKFTYLAPPETNDKKDIIDLQDRNLINGLGGFSENIIAPFLDALSSSGEEE
jgi:hypothetical protein